MELGRPLKFKTVEEMQEKIDEFFKNTPVEEWTVTGLALALNTTRDLLLDYTDFAEFSDTIKTAKQKIRYEVEKRLIKRGNAGDIFLAKNFGYKDKQEIDTNISGEVKLSDLATLARQANNSNKK